MRRNDVIWFTFLKIDLAIVYRMGYGMGMVVVKEITFV